MHEKNHETIDRFSTEREDGSWDNEMYNYKQYNRCFVERLKNFRRKVESRRIAHGTRTCMNRMFEIKSCIVSSLCSICWKFMNYSRLWMREWSMILIKNNKYLDIRFHVRSFMGQIDTFY